MPAPLQPTPTSPSPPIPAQWWTEFHRFTLTHAIVLALVIAAIAISCYFGRLWRRQNTPESLSRERQLCAAWAGFMVCVNLWLILYWLEPAHFDIAKSLPLQMCDLAGLLAPLVFLTHWRPIRAILYFWGIGLSTQAFVQPTLTQGVGLPFFWIFWLNHISIVGSALYDLIVRRFRPTFRDFVLTVSLTLVWYIGVAFLNIALHSNYGYNGPSHPPPDTVIDLLGPWPLRVYLLAAIVIAWFALLWAVWPLTAKLRVARPS